MNCARHLLSRLLDKTHDVETARNASEVLAQFAPGRCDAAIIDLGLPEMPGDRLLAEMQRIDPSVVGILITGWDLEDGDARGAAFDFHIQKPFEDIAEVERAVADAMALHDERAGGRSTISNADFDDSPEEG